MSQTKPYTLAQYTGNREYSEFTKRRLSLGYTYMVLSTVTHIKPNRIIKLASLHASAQPNEVVALAKALLVSPEILRSWLVCMSVPPK